MKCQPWDVIEARGGNGLRKAYIEKYVANPASEANRVKTAGEAFWSQGAGDCGMSAPVRSVQCSAVEDIKPRADDNAMTGRGSLPRERAQRPAEFRGLRNSASLRSARVRWTAPRRRRVQCAAPSSRAGRPRRRRPPAATRRCRSRRCSRPGTFPRRQFPRIENESAVANPAIEILEIVRRIGRGVKRDDDRRLQGVGRKVRKPSARIPETSAAQFSRYRASRASARPAPDIDRWRRAGPRSRASAA